MRPAPSLYTLPPTSRSLVEILIAAKAEVDAPHPHTGESPLYHCAANRNAEVLQLLLRSNVRVTAPHNRLALHNAALHGDVASIHALLQAGADVRAAGGDGSTALMGAAQNGIPPTRARNVGGLGQGQHEGGEGFQLPGSKNLGDLDHLVGIWTILVGI